VVVVPVVQAELVEALSVELVRAVDQPTVNQVLTTPVPVAVETLHLEITQPWAVRVDLEL
jgi:hypothetical protein